ncbi:MAG: 50S ribosomal protein L1 [Bacteroidia bacterium]|nr:50S ribosomal protein L1 [Bacteroidia bacterium]
MAKRSKKYTTAAALLASKGPQKLADACSLVKQVSYTKFDGSVDLAVKLGVDPRQANQMVRGVASLPHGTGKEVRVLVLTGPDNEAAAKDAGADLVGLDEFISKIEGGWTDVDVIICTPDVMPKVGRLGRVLGPRGLMPNPKSGTVTTDVGKTVREVKAGKIDFKVDRTGIVHAAIGKTSFSAQQLADNANELLQVIQRLKPQGLKDTYVKSVFLSATMSPSVEVDKATLAGF